MNSKPLILGILLILAIGIGGFLYRYLSEHPSQGGGACTTDAKVCPDGTTLSRTGPSCTFPACPSPNVELTDAGISFALPTGYLPLTLPDTDAIAAFSKTSDSGGESDLIVRQFALGSSTASDFIRANAVLSPSGMPAPATAFSTTSLGGLPGHTFTVVTIERFEGVVDIAYYLTRGDTVFRFDAVEHGVDWTNPSLDITTLNANKDLRTLLGTLQA